MTAIKRISNNWQTAGIPFTPEKNIYTLVKGISLLNDRLMDDLETLQDNFGVENATGEALDLLGDPWGVGRRNGETDDVFRERLEFTVYADSIAPDIDSYIEFLADLNGTATTDIDLTPASGGTPVASVDITSSAVTSNLSEATRTNLAKRALPVGHDISVTYI